MPEVIISAVGFVLAVGVGFFAWLFISTVESYAAKTILGIVVVGPIALVALYCFVRIVHWAWITPIPIP